jgi:hypothetical protein
VSLRLLGRRKFWELLFGIDRDVAASARERRCVCGGVLHAANFPRKPRGGPTDLGREYGVRFSLCCAVDGCRRRVTPESVRFLGRRVFFGAVVVLVAALREGLTPRRLAVLRRLFGVTRSTIERWRRWWREEFPGGEFWRAVRGRFVPAIAADDLPQALLDRFVRDAQHEPLVGLLRFLVPRGAG